MEFNDNMATNSHGVDVGILGECVFMAKELPVTGESTMILHTVDMTSEEIMSYLNIQSFADFDQINEAFLWQMYRKEDAYVNCFFESEERGREIEYHLSLSDGKTVLHNITDNTIEEIHQILDSAAKIEVHLLNS